MSHDVHTDDPEFWSGLIDSEDDIWVAVAAVICSAVLCRYKRWAHYRSDIEHGQGRKKRKTEDEPRSDRDYWGSTWGKLLKTASVSNPKSKKGKLFRRRFRVPYVVFLHLVQVARDKKWYHDKPFSITGEPLPPLELLMCGVLRILGRGVCFDEVAELCNISETSVRLFFHAYCKHMAQEYPKYIYPPSSDEEIEATLHAYEQRGFPGCIGSADGVHVAWDKAPAMDLPWYKGKENYPTLAYQCTVDHAGRCIACTMGFPGTVTDKTIARYDTFMQSVHTGERYGTRTFRLRDANGNWRSYKGLYLIVDQGYHKWRALQSPLSYTSSSSTARDWSTRLESNRKDVECFFGRLKGRFRILKIPINYHHKTEIDNVFVTCIILHNILLWFDGLDTAWEREYNYEGADGMHDDMDIGKVYAFSTRSTTVTPDTDVGRIRRGGRRAVERDVAAENGRRPSCELGEDLVTSVEQGYFDLQSALVTHYGEARARHEIVWEV
jgi:hypothetical protein